MPRGRKRKMGKRTPTGQLSRAGHDPRDLGTPEMQRMVRRMDTKGSSAVMTDQLCAAGIITDEMNDAASTFRELRQRAYGQVSPKIGAYADMVSEGTLRPILEVDAAHDPQAKALAKYNEARLLLQERCPSGVAVEVTRVVIDGARPLLRNDHDLERLQYGLAVLASYFVGGDLKIILDRAAQSAEAAHEKRNQRCA